MFGQLCVADADGVAAGAADVLPDEVVPDTDDDVDVVVAAGVDECVVVALATAMLPPNPTPSAPAATAVPMMSLPSLDFTVSSCGQG
jgi:hypothetical protein